MADGECDIQHDGGVTFTARRETSHALTRACPPADSEQSRINQMMDEDSASGDEADALFALDEGQRRRERPRCHVLTAHHSCADNAYCTVREAVERVIPDKIAFEKATTTFPHHCVWDSSLPASP